MAKRFELLVFDWDGTLMDSAAAIVTAIQSACRDLDLPEPSDALARHVIGLGLEDAMKLAVPELEPSAYPRMAERYRHHYLLRDHELILFGGIRELIQELEEAGHYLAVATGKSRMGLSRALEVSGLGPYFHATRCADECFSKPHPQMLEELMEELGVAPGETVMIGDTTHDLLMATNAGVASLAVSYGAHEADVLSACSPLATFSRVDELSTWLKANA